MRRSLIALALVATVLPATAAAAAAPRPNPSAAVVSGPTYVYDKAYARVRTMVAAYQDMSGGTGVAFLVTGMPPSAWGRRFGVHVHTNPCGRNPAAAGPHYAFPGVPPTRPLSRR